MTYLLSFTSAGLSHPESVTIARTYLEAGDWPATRDLVLGENLLQARTQSAGSRKYRELDKRLQALSDSQLELLVEGSMEEQKQLLWAAVCLRYQFVREFAVEIIREKFLVMDFHVSTLDFDAFYHHKADWHEELNRLSDQTRERLRQMLFQMMRQAGIITDGHRIEPVTLSTRLLESLRAEDPALLLIYPMHFYGV